eukprot:gnl/TRDRNA2_/TRDRNA2_75151_c1_seq1.p1 gnl/TRDRNA2_/TRDRNA2_75151_c1~~gnl/TRDRNA2_/TRDRNA2_75151_c1_seq1.p1  ORF type:complete len:159 (+),score=21.52 gnl/TRDRNA2_/TRDRNA2_75151_c1_seq1:59-478(+)
MAWHRPELFRRVLAYSATMVNQQCPFNPASPLGCWEYHGGQQIIANCERKPLRVCLYNMEHDFGFELAEETWHNWTLANRRMAAVLRQKGYPYRHVFCKKAYHVDGRVLQQTLAAALEWLWEGYGQLVMQEWKCGLGDA